MSLFIRWKAHIFFTLPGLASAWPIQATQQDWQNFAQQTDLKLQSVLNEKFTQNLRQVESDMRHEMEVFIGPYHGIQRELLLQFIHDLRQRENALAPRG